MSQVDELYKGLSQEEIETASANHEIEPHIVIDKDRNIFVPDVLKRIGVENDHDVETVTFDCPRFWDEHDLITMVIYINYMRADGYKDSFKAKNIEIDNDDSNIIHFDWTVSRNVTGVKGDLSFLVCARRTDSEGNEKNHWNSELCNDMYVSEGLECVEIALANYPDLVTHLLTQMDAPVTPERLDRRYWEFNAQTTVTAYADLDMLFEYDEANATIYNIHFTGLSSIKSVVGDGDFLVCISVDNESMLLMNKTNGDIWTYTKGSEKLTKVSGAGADADQSFNPFSKNAQSGIAVAEALKDYTGDLIHIGTFSYMHELKMYPFAKDKLYTFSLDGELLEMIGESINNRLLGVFELSGPSSNPFKILNAVPYLDNYGNYYMINITDETITKMGSGAENSGAESPFVDAGYFDNLDTLQAYGFEEGKLYRFTAGGTLHHINVSGDFIGILNSYDGYKILTCISYEYARCIRIKFTDGSSGEVIGRSGFVDDTYDSTSRNAQSGKAVEEAIETRLSADCSDYKHHLIGGNGVESDWDANDFSFTQDNLIFFPGGDEFAVENNGACRIPFDQLKTQVLKIKDEGQYYESDGVEGALQEIGSTLSNLEDFLASI